MACMVTLSPKQMVSDERMVISGLGLTMMVSDVSAEQPLAAVAVTVYVPCSLIRMELVVLPLLHA